MGRNVKNEHFVPAEGKSLEDYLVNGEKTPVHHLVRYRWAKAVISKLGLRGPILDVACGAGYGSHGIATAFPDIQVIGGDYDLEAIQLARKRYIARNLTFKQVDVTHWDASLGAQQFGCIISFDTIEHVEHREIMMQNIVEHLYADGALLLSTPVRRDNVLNPGWEHHKIEFARKSLYDFLRRYFREVLAPDFGTMPCADVFESINRDEIFYLLKMNPLVCRQPVRIEFGQ